METRHDWLLCPVIAHLILSGVAFIVAFYIALPLRLKRVATLDEHFKIKMSDRNFTQRFDVLLDC